MPPRKRAKKAAPGVPVRVGRVTSGRIKQLLRGQGTGIIATADRDVFFHKSDANGSFADMNVGDRVVFELLEDAISGPRAQKVRVTRRG
jgi:cold shock CspA family protein